MAVDPQEPPSPAADRRVFLFLQGPISPFFPRIADALEAAGHGVRRINLCLGDRLFWRRPGAIDYRRGQADWPAFIEAFLDREGITDILLLGEQRFYHKVAIEAAQQRGIAVTVTDFGYLRPDWITLEKDGMSGTSLFPKDPAAIRALARQVPPLDNKRLYHDSFWTMAVWDMVYHISSSLLWFLYPGYRTHQRHHPVLVYIGTGLRILLNRYRGPRATRLIEETRKGGVPYFVFPLQMETDFQIRAYSPYPDLRQPLAEIMTSFAAHAPAEAQLLVKVHPLDPGLVRWQSVVMKAARKAGVADRVTYLDGGYLERLLEKADGVVTINSTVGIWALLAGRPVKTLGEAIYDIKGLTFRGSLDAFWANPTPPDIGLAKAFLRAMAGAIQIRGVFYNEPGLGAAVAAATDRLLRRRINLPLDDPATQGNNKVD